MLWNVIEHIGFSWAGCNGVDDDLALKRFSKTFSGVDQPRFAYTIPDVGVADLPCDGGIIDDAWCVV